jgi:anti-anti-sigma regulatory factor
MIGIHFSYQGTTANANQATGDSTELVRGNEQPLLDHLMPVVRHQSVSLDLRSVTRIDAAGLAALITLHCEACKAGHTFTVAHLTRQVAEILQIVGLDKILVAQDAEALTDPCLQLQASAA